MTRDDIKIIITILIISIISIWTFKLIKPYEKNQYVVIKQEEKVLKNILIKDDGIYEFNFNNNVGYVEIKNNEVRMLPMDKNICPKRICSETSWINKSYESIVCLPNKLIVTFEKKSKKDIDEISI